MALNSKQQRFAEEYVIDLNATAAYWRAGYKPKDDHVAKVAASRLLTNVNVKAEVDRLIALRSAQAGLTAEHIWREWAAICRSDVGEILDFTGKVLKLRPPCEIPEHARRAIASIKVRRHVEGTGDSAREVEVTEFTLWNKPATLATVAKAMGELIERVLHTHSGPGGSPIRNEHTFEFLDITAEEYRALPAEERLRRLREAIRAFNRN